MKDNIYDTVLERTVNRIDMVSDRISKNFKNVKPFNKQPVDPVEQVYQYNQLTPQMWSSLRQSMGDQIVNEYIYKMEDLKRRL